MDDNQLTIRARAIARCLSYNGDVHEAAAKHTLHEMAHRLDAKNIRVHKKRDGLLLISGLGQARYMTFVERLRYRLFNVLPVRI
jgi:hypothetical protein